MNRIVSKSFLAILFIGIVSGCNLSKDDPDSLDNGILEENDGVISVNYPQPESEIDKIQLTASQKQIVAEENGFALDIMQRFLKERKDKSFVLSPLSISMDLAMAANATDGKARDEIMAALGHGSYDISDYNSLCKTLIEGLPAVDFSSKVRMANAILVNKRYPVKKGYQTMIGDYFYGTVESVSPDNAKIISTVNSWVNEATEGLIPKMIEDIASPFVACLINALYFKSAWAEPFDPNTVHKRVFHSPGEDASLDFIGITESYRYLENDTFSSVSVPFSRGKGKYCMDFILPNASSSISEALELISTQGWGNMVGSMSAENVNLVLPKFKTESSFDAISILEDLGIKTIFEGDRFNEMLANNYEPISVSQILHKAVLSLDENGVEAAAATYIGMKGVSQGNYENKVYEFIADRPFFYIIREKTSGAILFIGVFQGN